MTKTHKPHPQELAELARDAMWANDRACKALGMSVVTVGPGTATMEMTVRPDMLNGHDIQTFRGRLCSSGRAARPPAAGFLG